LNEADEYLTESDELIKIKKEFDELKGIKKHTPSRKIMDVWAFYLKCFKSMDMFLATASFRGYTEEDLKEAMEFYHPKLSQRTLEIN
jgi:hypothetical protein